MSIFLIKIYFSNIGYRDNILPNKIALLNNYGLLNEEDQRTSKRSLVLSMDLDGMSLFSFTQGDREGEREVGPRG